MRSLSLHGGLYRHFSPGMYEEEIRHLCDLSLRLQLTHDAARKSVRGKKEHIVMRKAPLFEGCEIGETNFGVTTIKIGVQAIRFISFCHIARIQTIGSSSEAQTSCPILFR
jgi:hypothetical protein